MKKATKKAATQSLLWCVLAAAFAVAPLTGCASGADPMDKSPESFKLQDRSLQRIDRKEMQPIDRASLLAREREVASTQARPGPTRFAVSEEVAFTLDNAGTWHDVPNGRVWRLLIRAPQALSINLNFSRFDLPEGAKLWLYDPARKLVQGPYTARDRSPRGRLATPIIEGEELVVELFTPAGATKPAVEIGAVNKAFRTLN